MLNLLQIAAYEREISKLREELLKEIGHLEERKEEAVKAAANCSAEHFQNLQDQFFSELHQIIKPLKKEILVSAHKKIKENVSLKRSTFWEICFFFLLVLVLVL